jgi:CheY-like chemotaxis protein
MNDAHAGRRARNRLLLGFKTRTRVIVADDDEQMRSLLLHVLTDEGYEVVEAADGHELGELLQIDGTRPILANVDAVIADIRMPGSGGLEVLAALRAVDWAMPVILITAFLDDDVAAEGARLGAAAVFSKPFILRDLVATMQSLLPVRFA